MCVILSERSESKDPRITSDMTDDFVQRSFDSLHSLRMTVGE